MSSISSDPFPSSEFDDWATQYDQDVDGEGFPFTGYQRVLTEIVRLADVRGGMTLLDLGVGTGNLAELFLPSGCELWCTDFSSQMLEQARVKLPSAHLSLHDLRQPFPPSLQRRFDRIVSAYVFHHFEMDEKIMIIDRLIKESLIPGGCLVIGDISFPNQQTLDAVRQAASDQWDDELYWVAAEALPALHAIHVEAAYFQISNCAGIYQLSR
jgi:putative AdoMet-dependent methyltransferase